MAKKVDFTGGSNIALKVPGHQWEDTVMFYRDILCLAVAEEHTDSVVFEFGSLRLWVDRVDTISQSEIWLEIETDDTETAGEYLKSAGVVRRDEIEKLPEGFDGFWVSGPSSTIHLVKKK